jgi:hypothetical protein
VPKVSAQNCETRQARERGFPRNVLGISSGAYVVLGSGYVQTEDPAPLGLGNVCLDLCTALQYTALFAVHIVKTYF